MVGVHYSVGAKLLQQGSTDLSLKILKKVTDGIGYKSEAALAHGSASADNMFNVLSSSCVSGTMWDVTRDCGELGNKLATVWKMYSI